MSAVRINLLRYVHHQARLAIEQAGWSEDQDCQRYVHSNHQIQALPMASFDCPKKQTVSVLFFDH
jgi:hypothetical protein